MTPAADRIAEAVAAAYRSAGIAPPVPPAGDADPVGPVPLRTLLEGFGLFYEEVDALTAASAAAALARWGIALPARVPADADAPLAGFLYAGGGAGAILVRRGDDLRRKRFTAAHELGHFLLHVPAGGSGDGAGELLMEDGEATLADPGGAADDADAPAPAAGTRMPASDDPREAEANRFAAELLMPAGLCRALAGRHRRAFGAADGAVEQHVAADLLVNTAAARIRLRNLGLVGGR
jgi:hypothetical protein